MKLQVKMAGICGSGMFLLLAYTAYFSSMEPFKVFYIAVPGAVIGCIIGYQMGMILSHPKGPSPSKRPSGKKGASSEQKTNHKPPRRQQDAGETEVSLQTAITGDESFIDDLEKD